MEAFFFNMPEAEVKKKLWGLFAGWVYQASETADGKEIAQMLFFYERLWTPWPVYPGLNKQR